MWSQQGGWSSGGWGRPLSAGFSLTFSTYSSNTDLTNATPAVAFTRASSGTRFNSSGVLGSVSTNVARFDYDPATLSAKGLLVEEARTNIVPQSQNLGTTWNATISLTVAASGITDPTGTLQKVTPSATTSGQMRLFQTGLATTTGTQTLSFYYKAGSGVTHIHARSDGSSTYGQCITLATDALSTAFYDGGNAASAPTSASVTDVGNGIRRFQMSFPVSGTTTFFYYFATTSASSSGTFSGSDFCYVGGAQIEAGSYPTSYIPTTTAAVTRSADAASFTIPGGATNLRTTYGDDSTADTTGVTPGATYNIPTGQKAIKSIVSF